MNGTSIDPFDRPDSQFNTLQDWTWVGCYGGYYLQSDLLQQAGFEHGFFTRLWQGREPDALAGYISAGVSVHRPNKFTVDGFCRPARRQDLHGLRPMVWSAIKADKASGCAAPTAPQY